MRKQASDGVNCFIASLLCRATAPLLTLEPFFFYRTPSIGEDRRAVGLPTKRPNRDRGLFYRSRRLLQSFCKHGKREVVELGHLKYLSLALLRWQPTDHACHTLVSWALKHAPQPEYGIGLIEWLSVHNSLVARTNTGTNTSTKVSWASNFGKRALMLPSPSISGPPTLVKG